jgi:hypothetical protein
VPALRADTPLLRQEKSFTGRLSDAVASGGSTKKMEEIIDSARESLIIVGTTPLFEFAKKPDVLIKRFQQLKSVTIAYLDSDSKYVRSREVQAGISGCTMPLRFQSQGS